MAPFSFSDQGSLCLVKVIVVNIVVGLFRIRYLVLNWGAVLFLIISTFYLCNIIATKTGGCTAD